MTSYTQKLQNRMIADVMSKVEWKQAPDAISGSEIVLSTVSQAGEWKNLKDFLLSGRIPANPLHSLSRGVTSVPSSGNENTEMSVLNSGEANEYFVSPRDFRVENTLKKCEVKFSIDPISGIAEKKCSSSEMTK